MARQYLVISQFAKEKEIAPWWETRTLQQYSAEIFADFASAKSFMRKRITDMLADSRDLIIQQVFGDIADPDKDDYDEDSDDTYDILMNAITEMMGSNSYLGCDSEIAKIQRLTKAIMENPDYFPETIEEITETDDADHYQAFVCNENYVLADGGDFRVEYNVHQMENDAFLYYFFVFAQMEQNMECVMSVKLINTEETINNSAIKIEDTVTCKQVELGTFVQKNGENPQPIVWDVLDEQEDRMLVVSHKCLDYRVFNNGRTSATWGKSAIRSWLNGDFWNTAFSEQDKQQILLSHVSNGRAKPTEDYIFLLSRDEFKLLAYENRTAFLTDYARKQYSGYTGERYTEPYGFWWLRSRGIDVQRGYDVTHVCANGTLNGFARSDSSHPNGIRPAMWIKK